MSDFHDHDIPTKLPSESWCLIQRYMLQRDSSGKLRRKQRHSRVLLHGHMDKKRLRKAVGDQESSNGDNRVPYRHCGIV